MLYLNLNTDVHVIFRWNRARRRQWWRSLGQISETKSSSEKENKQGHQVFTIPVDPSHVPKSRKKRTVVGLYSYAPWLTNDVRK